VVEVELEVPIAAAPERVWEALVNETSAWWRRDFLAPNARGFFIEPRLGGRAFEDRGEGSGLVWFTVVGLEPARSLDLLGHLTPAYGGPAMTMVHIELEAKGGKTTVKLSDSTFGPRVGAELRGSLDMGWKALFAEGLRTYVEGGS
jgi:uncharacterized protein YndB with AHSA1/START domain